MSYHIELFHALLNDFLQGEAALIQLDGDVLAVRGKDPVSYGTLSSAAQTVTKYLSLQEGDIALLNDPYSGGSLLSEMTFVMAVSEDLLWVSRRSLAKAITLETSVEKEGVRIPPTPLKQKNLINEAILSAIQSHPSCPAHFADWIRTQCHDLTAKAKKLHDAIELTGFTVTSELLEEYTDLCRQSAQQKISERSSGETRVDVILDSGELLRVSMNIRDGKIALDFGGSTAAKSVSLTEAATFGACFHTLSRYYGFEQFANSGSFSILQLTKPSGCWLVGKYPAATYRGMTSGVAAIQTALELALSIIHQKNETSFTNHCDLFLDLRSSASQTLLTLKGGTGASADSPGKLAWAEAFSVEELEKKFPVKVHSITHRSCTPHLGKFVGGKGLELKIEATADLRVMWNTDLTLHRPRLSKNCHHGPPTEVLCAQTSVEKNNEEIKLPSLGQQTIPPGTTLTLRSGSGGGYGKE